MSKSYSNLFEGTIGASAKVWDDITPTQSNYPGTVIPSSFSIKINGRQLWVHPNATEHIVDYIKKKADEGYALGATRLTAQILLYDMQRSLSESTKSGILYNRILHHGNWDFVIRQSREANQYDAVIHAFVKL